MRTLITNGTIVTADGSYAADVLDRRRDDRRRSGATWPAAGVTRRRDDRRDRASTSSRAAIDVHTHMELPFGGTFAKDTFETGHARGGLRRDDDDRRLRRPVARASRCARASTPGTPRPRATPSPTTAST